LSLVPLANALGAEFPFYVVSLENPPSGQSFDETLPAQAERILGDLRSRVRSGPFFLGGYSIGGLVALELARKMLAEREEVALLVLFDVHGPGFPKLDGRRDRIRGHYEKMLSLSTLGKIDYVSKKIRERLRRTAGARKHQKQPVSSLWRSYRSYLNALPRYPGRITLLRAAIQPERLGASYDDRTNGWGRIAEGGVEVIEVAGGHLTMFDQTHLPELAKVLRRCFQGATTRA
jgi:thioesterase domain-containing protein